MADKTILFFGGSGSLGNAFIQKNIHNNKIINYSRDENKHWEMDIKYQSKNLKSIIGDIRDLSRVEETILRENPNIIIIASALKHVDRCELSVTEAIKTNFEGVMNILNSVEKYDTQLANLECVLFISTDKACEPTNVYGCCKALSESAVIEKSFYNKRVKFISVRYGNVVNSRGSIIPLLHTIGKDVNKKHFTITHEDMTRFLMTLEQSVDLIEYAISNAESGDIVLPELISIKIKDLVEIFSEMYNKPIVITGIRPGEKMLESLISETQSYRLIQDNNGYYFIKPCYKGLSSTDNAINYNSKVNPLSKDELRNFLHKKMLL